MALFLAPTTIKLVTAALHAARAAQALAPKDDPKLTKGKSDDTQAR